MKILVLNGSPRSSGNTVKMIEQFSKKHVKYISIHYEAKGKNELISYSYLIKEKGIIPMSSGYKKSNALFRAEIV